MQADDTQAVQASLTLAFASPRGGEPGTLAHYFYGFQHIAVPAPGPQSVLAVGDTARSNRAAAVVRHWRIDVSVEGVAEPAMFSHGKNGLLELDVQVPRAGEVSVVVSPHQLETRSVAGIGSSSGLYADSWAPVALLSGVLELCLARLAAMLGSVGSAIVVLALVFRLALYRLSRWSLARQLDFEARQAALKERLAALGGDLRGVERSQAIVNLHKELGISPLSGLAGSTSLLVLLPLLIAMFAVTSESALFAGVSFLWIHDLSQVDALFALPTSIPGFGATFNVLPLMLGGVMVVLARARPGASAIGLGSVVSASLVTCLFYSFASALLLFWLTMYAAQILEMFRFNATDGMRGEDR